MSKLTKITRIYRLQGSPGIPDDPGRPAIPSYWETIPGAVQVSAPEISLYFDDSTGEWVYVPVQPGPWANDPAPTQRLTPPVPAVPPTPGNPPTSDQITIDLNLGWNSGAVSKLAIPGDCTLVLRVSAGSAGVVAGLNSLNYGSGYSEIDHGIYFSSGTARALENGQIKGFSLGFISADEFAIARAGSSVEYRKNGVAFYTSLTPSFGQVFADCSLYAGGDEISDARFDGLVNCAAILPALTGLSSDIFNYNDARSILTPTASSSSDIFNGNEARSILPALTGLSSDISGYNEARSTLPALTSCSVQYAASVECVLPALQSLSASGSYNEAHSILAPTRSRSGAGELAPPVNSVVCILGPTTGYSQVVQGTAAECSAVLAPSISLSASGSYNEAKSILAPLFGLSAQVPPIGNNAHLVMPAGIVRGHGRSSGAGRANVILEFGVKAWGGAVARLTMPSPSVAGSATTVFSASSALTMPAGVVRGSSSTIRHASAAITLPDFRVSGNCGGRAEIALPGFSVLASGSWHQPAVALLVMPLFSVSASASTRAISGAALFMPAPYLHRGATAALVMPAAFVVASGSAVLVATFEAYSINLAHSGAAPQVDEVTRYTSFPFTQIVRFQGDYFGVAADGLYRLGGATDDGEPIAFSLKTCVSDFDAPELKTCPSAYLAGRIGPDSTVTLFAGEEAGEQYAHTTPRGQLAQAHRQKFGRGIKNRYFSIGVSGEDAFSLDSMELEINKLSRRI